MAKATAVRVSTGKKFSQLLIITPAVAIDNNNDGGYSGPFTAHDSGCGSSGSDASLEQCDDGGNERISSDRRNNNGKSTRSKLLPKVRQQIVTTGSSSGSSSSTGCGGGNPAQSWRWCSIICSAVRCFRAATNSQPPFGTIHYSSSGVTTSDGQTTATGGGRSVRNGQASTRFSTNHIYEYTIKSYRADSTSNDHINNNGNRGGSDANDRNVMYKL